MSIPISGASYVYGDNVLVIHNITKPESTLNKKGNAIAFHAIHKSVVMGETLTGHMRPESNLSDVLTKTVTGHKSKHLVSLVLYDLYDRDT